MEMRMACPTCGTTHMKEVTHEWVTDAHKRRKLQLILVSQSNNTDGGRMEGLVPFADDGLAFTVKGEWLDERRVMLTIGREPKTGDTKDAAETPAAAPQTRADMETDAAECGLKMNPRWNDLQLAKALEDHKARKLHATVMTK